MINIVPTISLDSNPSDVPQPGQGQVFVFFLPDGTLNCKLPDNSTVQLVPSTAAAGAGGTFALPVGMPPGGLISATNLGDVEVISPSTVGSCLCVLAPGQLGWRDLAQAIAQLGVGEAPEDGTVYGRKNGEWADASQQGDAIGEAPLDGQLYGRQAGGWDVIPPAGAVTGLAPGTLLYAGADGTLTELAPGTAGQVLTMATATTLAWATVAAGSGTGGGGGGGGGGSTTGTELQYASGGDENGLFYWLGTSLGTAAFSNPATAHKVNLSASPSYEGPDVSALVGRQAVNWDILPGDNNYLQIDLTSANKLAPTVIALQNRASFGSQNGLTTAVLQGSNDAINYTNLGTLNLNFTTPGQWVPCPIAAGTAAYRFFRVVRNAPTSSGDEYLCLGQIEMYGTLNP